MPAALHQAVLHFHNKKNKASTAMIKFPKLNIHRLESKGFSTALAIDPKDISLLFDGKHSMEDIYCQLLSEHYSLHQINELFDYLIQQELISDKISISSKILSEQEVDYFTTQITTLSNFNLKTAQSAHQNYTEGLLYQEKICLANVIVCGDSQIAEDLVIKFRKMGVRNLYSLNKEEVLRYTGSGNLVYAPNNYAESELVELIDYASSHHLNFLPVINTTFGIEIGPFYILKESSCYQCLIDRKKSILGENYNHNISNKLQFNFSIGADLVALEILKQITGITSVSTRNNLLQFNHITGNIKYQPVLKVPNCKICGSKHAKPERKLWEGIL
jgi:hypothetical protein